MAFKAATYQSKGSDYSLSISDLMASLLFVFMIALVVFAIMLNKQIEKEKQQLQHMTNARQIRNEILQSLEHSLTNQGIQVKIDLDNGILRIPEQILFRSGSATLDSSGAHSMRVVASVLDSLLPHYTYLKDTVDYIVESSDYTNKRKLEAIFVEGHTDNLPLVVGAKYSDNWELSAARAITTYRALTSAKPRLDSLKNYRSQKIFSVSGYADSRSVSPGINEEQRKFDRRIDLRFLMMPPDTIGLKLD